MCGEVVEMLRRCWWKCGVGVDVCRVRGLRSYLEWSKVNIKNSV